MSRAQLTSTVEQSSGGVVAPFLAGKNKILNGDFSIWQRGTSFSNPSTNTYSADRYVVNFDGSGATRTISQQAFTVGTAPVTGYESAYFLRYNQSVAGSGGTYLNLEQRIEDARVFANQTVTFSFWAKADSSRTVNVGYNQYFGSGGSSTNYSSTQNITLTTSWARYSVNFSIASIAGKTIGSGSFLGVDINMPPNTAQTIDTWGWQLEAGSVATPFTTCANTLQGELALCQRYLPVFTGGSLSGYAYATNGVIYSVKFPVQARVAPTSMVVVSQSNIYSLNTSVLYTPTFNLASTDGANIVGAITVTAGQGSRLEGGYIYFTGCEL